MYNNFSSKKTKKVISALLASALVVTSAPITADAATTKVLGVKKTFTVKKTTKVSGLSKAEKKIVKVTVNKSKRTVTVKGVKPGKASFKIGSKSYTVKVGAVAIKKKSFATSLKVGTNKKVTVTSSYGAKDTLKWSSSKTSVVKVSKATTTASAKKVATNTLKPVKAGTATITVKSKNTGKSLKVKVTVKAAETATATPATTPTTVPTATGSATTTPSVAPTATTTATATGSATTTPNVAPTATVSGGATTAPSTVPTATGSATTAPTATGSAVPSANPTAGPTTTPTQVVSGTVVSIVGVNTQDQEVSTSSVTKNGSLKVTFSKVVKKSTVNNSTITITDDAGKNISLPVSDVTLNVGGQVATVKLNNLGLEKNKTYTLSVKGVQDADGSDIVAYSTTFTVVNTAVVKAVVLDSQSDYNDFDTNLETRYYDDVTPNAPFTTQTIGKTIVVRFDEYVDQTTTTASNVILTNKTTGERVACTYSVNSGNGYLVIGTKTSLISNNMYELTIDGVKTAVGGDVEKFSHVFTVNGKVPLTGTVQYRTVDGTDLKKTSYAWSKLTAGVKTDATDMTSTKYYAGLQILVTVDEILDADSVKENVLLVEKETNTEVKTNISYDATSRMITIVPTADLKEDTDYEIQYMGGLKTTENVPLNANKKHEVVTTGEELTFKTIDATAPEVVSLESSTGTTSFETTKAHEFTITFSESVNIDKDNVLLTETSTDLELASADAVSGITVSKVAGSDDKKYTVRIPANSLDVDKTYRISVIGADMKDYGIVTSSTKAVIKDDSDDNYVNYLAKSTNYTFSTTVDSTAPSIVNIYDGDEKVITDADKIITNTTKTNVGSDGATFTFVFDEEVYVNEAATPTNFFTVEEYDNGWKPSSVGASATAMTDKDGKQTIVKVDIGAINADMKYRLVLEKGAIRDHAGTNLTPNSDPSKDNIMSQFRYEFIGTDGNDTAAHVHVYQDTDPEADNVTEGTDEIVNNGSSDTQKNVNIKTHIFVVLDEKEIVSPVATNLVVKDTKGNVVEGKFEQVSDTTVLTNLGAYGIENPGETAHVLKAVLKFTPAKDLAHGTKYIVTVDGLKDVIGNTIEKKEVTFETVAEDLKVTSISIDGVTDDKQTSVNMTPEIKVAFNDDASTAGATVTLYKGDTSVTPSLKHAYSDDGKTYTMQFKNDDEIAGNGSETLDANTTYTITVTKGGKELKKFTFTTGYVAKDVVAPEINETAGKPDIYSGTLLLEKDVVNGLDGNDFSVTYNEKISKTDAKISVVQIDDSTKVATHMNTSLSDDKKTITFKTLGIDSSKTYKVVITGVKDEAGNAASDITLYVTADLASYKAALKSQILEAYNSYDLAKYTVNSGTTVGGLTDIKDKAIGASTGIFASTVTTIAEAKSAYDTAIAAMTAVETDAKILEKVDASHTLTVLQNSTNFNVSGFNLKNSADAILNDAAGTAIAAATATYTVAANNTNGDFAIASNGTVTAATKSGYAEVTATITLGSATKEITFYAVTDGTPSTTYSLTKPETIENFVLGTDGKLVITLSDGLYDGASAEYTTSTDVKAKLTFDDDNTGGVVINSAIYNADNNTITVTFTGTVEVNDKIVFDNAMSATATTNPFVGTLTFDGTAWR